MHEAFSAFIRKMLPPLVELGGAVLTVAVIFAVAIGVSWLARRQLEPMLSRRAFGRNGALLIGRILSVLAFVLAFLISLASLGVNTTGLFTFLSAFTVAIGLSLQDVLKNFFSGILLLIERPFSVGDRVQIRDIEGEIQGIDIRTTLIRNTQGALVLVPNSVMFTEVLTNRSHFRTRRLDLTISTMTLPIDDAERRIVAALDDLAGVRKPIPPLLVKCVGPESRTLGLSLLIDARPDVEQKVMRALMDQLGDATIEIGEEQ